MPRKLTNQEFIDRANIIHNFEYDYNNVDYTGSMKKVNIICPVHGMFEQTPNSHINDKFGCPSCAYDKKALTEDKFIQKSTYIHGNKYGYGNLNFVGSQGIVDIMCPTHGKFSQYVQNHLNGMGCAKCSGNTKSNTADFISKAKHVHGDLYDYASVDYINARSKVAIKCNTHGIFYQTPNGHLGGQGCSKCADILRRGGYSMRYFNVYPEKKTEGGTLYVVKLFNTHEVFYKVGITQSDIYTRFKYNPMPYEYEILETLKGTLFDIYIHEQNIIKSNKNIQYIPTIKFSGYTECFYDRIQL